MENKKELIHSDLSRSVIGCCFEVIKVLGPGFLENVYKNALFVTMQQKGLNVSGLPIGLLVNFGHQRLEYKRLEHPDMFVSPVDFTELVLSSPS